MDFNLSSLAWLAVIPALGLLVLVHELGHFYMAIKMGVKVLEFGIGIPPRAVTLFERKGVKYTLNWLPLGGFVRMLGEDGNFNEPGSLASAPPWRKIPILAAGVIMNIITAMVLFAIIFAIWGARDTSRVIVGGVIDASPAQAAGIKQGATLVSVDGQSIVEPNDLTEIMQADPNKPREVVVEQDGQRQTFTLTPRVLENASVQDGRPKLGIGPSYPPEPVRVGILEAIWRGITITLSMFVAMLVGFGQLIAGLFRVAPAPEGGVTGIIGIARITGEAARNGMRQYMELTALLSVNLALINILPIPALDGSRIVFALIEWVRRGRKIAPEKEAMVHALGMIFLLGLMVLISITDVGRAISGAPALP